MFSKYHMHFLFHLSFDCASLKSLHYCLVEYMLEYRYIRLYVLF